MLGSAYVHFPYCLAKCPYCDFVSYKAAPESIDHEGYADAVVRELRVRAPAFVGSLGKDASVGSVFFGGGTPSLWAPSALGRVLRELERALPLTRGAEITVECNPTSLDEEKARALRGVGVNRLSIGTQSLDAASLAFLGRLHDPDGAVRSIEGAQRAGVPRISTDMIFGLPDEAPGAAAAQAKRLAGMGLEHLSAYQLTIEPGTQFGELARRGRLPLADDGRVAAAFIEVDETLTALGFRHYEISNYAKPGQEARHNLGYWNGDPYLGLGCAAYGTFAGKRIRNEPLPEKYVAWTETLTPEDAMKASTVEPLDGDTRLRERIMLGLRLEGGFDFEAAAQSVDAVAWNAERKKAAAWLVERGRLVIEGTRLRIPRAAWLFADDTAARMF